MAKQKERILLTESEGFTVVAHKPEQEFEQKIYARLFGCYQNPSQMKCNIYHYWAEIFQRFTMTCYSSGVNSYNCMMFTFGADCLVMYHGRVVPARFYITKTRQEVTIYDL